MTTPTPGPYLYDVAAAPVAAVVDGDTYDLTLARVMDFGFYLLERKTWTSRFRLAGYDCPEKAPRLAAYRDLGYDDEQARRLADLEKIEAAHAQTLAESWIRDALTANQLKARTEKDPDAFGRWLVDLFRADTGEHLGAVLELELLATPWPTRWRETYAGRAS